MKLADGNHFETVTSSYLSEMLIEFGIICYTDADPVFDESHFFPKIHLLQTQNGQNHAEK